MAVRIRLKRFGKKKKAFYRVVVMDSRTKRDSKVIEEVGIYNPIGKQVHLKEKRITDWLNKGALPTETVKNILKKVKLI